jgi:hypothetical protein
MKKLTYEFVKESFEKEGHILLSEKYINSVTKLDYICSKGHKHNICWADWSQGHRCSTCAGQTKPTIEQVKESFKNEDYILLSEEYVNSNTKLNYICPKGHNHNIRWGHWKRVQRCPTCAVKPKLTLEQVRESFSKEGCTLLSKEYNHTQTKLDYICVNGHKHSICYSNWQRGIRCPTCHDIRQSISNSGPGNPSWKGGISYEPYCHIWSDKEYKADIKLRDGNKCLNPYCNKKSNKLHIHHINYDKKDCHPSNLITVCNSCNSKANTDRDWHTVWYQAIIKNRYGGI